MSNLTRMLTSAVFVTLAKKVMQANNSSKSLVKCGLGYAKNRLLTHYLEAPAAALV